MFDLSISVSFCHYSHLHSIQILDLGNVELYLHLIAATQCDGFDELRGNKFPFSRTGGIEHLRP